MKKLLVVEDDENKRARIMEFIRKYYPSVILLDARSLRSGVGLAYQEKPDIVFLDMTLPNFDIGPDEPGGQHHIFGGQEFVRQMERLGVEAKIVVVTQFETFGKAPNIINIEQLDSILREESPDAYLGTVYYHASIEKWQVKLKEFADQILNQ